MSIKKKRYAWAGVLTVIVLAFIMGAFTAPNMAIGKSSWKWTKKYPKPKSWKWDKSYWPTKPVRGGYYRVARLKYIGLMNPNHLPVNDWESMAYMYERLVYSDATYKPSVQWMAESWKYLNPKTVIMKLRKGIKFHDGSDFNADSLKYQMEWILDKKMEH